MNTQIIPGFFQMSDVTNIFRHHDLVSAKLYCNQRIDNFVHNHPKTKVNNIERARQMILKARSVANLAQAVSNYVLAHQSEGLKVI